MSARLIVLSLLVLILAVPAAATVSEHPDFTENFDRPLRIVLLPVQSSITRGRLTDAESLIEETAVLERALAREAEAALERLGYDLNREVASAEALASDPQLLALADEARDRAMESLAQASRDPRGVSLGRFTIDEAALPLAVHAQAQGLLVLQSQSLIVSKGSKALGAVLNPFNLMSTATRTQVVGALFDMRDGQLLALVSGRDVGPVLKKPDAVARESIESAFRDFPAQGTSRRAKRKHRRAAPPRELIPLPPADPRSEEALLAAFEEVAAASEEPLNRDAAPGHETPAPPASEDAQGEPATPPAAGDREAGEGAAPLGTEEREALWRLLETPPSARPEPSLQAVFLGDAGATGLAVRNMSPHPVRVSLDRDAFVLLEPGGLLERELRAGSHRLLVAHAEEERELVRAAVIVREDRVAIAELWPRRE